MSLPLIFSRKNAILTLVVRMPQVKQAKNIGIMLLTLPTGIMLLTLATGIGTGNYAGTIKWEVHKLQFKEQLTNEPWLKTTNLLITDLLKRCGGFIFIFFHQPTSLHSPFRGHIYNASFFCLRRVSKVKAIATVRKSVKIRTPAIHVQAFSLDL